MKALLTSRLFVLALFQRTNAAALSLARRIWDGCLPRSGSNSPTDGRAAIRPRSNLNIRSSPLSCVHSLPHQLYHLLSYTGTLPISMPTPAPMPSPIFSMPKPSLSGGGLLNSFSLPTPLTPSGPSPQTRYWMARPASHVAWKIPHALNAHGTSPFALAKKNHILNVSPTTQFAITLGRNPLHPRRCQFASNCGSGRVASIANATAPRRSVYGMNSLVELNSRCRTSNTPVK
jgi:hypothetical protein